MKGQDPLVAFLYDLKRGHCEYFAGAMTLMCQSLGMEARMVIGFKCDEYNDVGHYYIVRQSHAHAWVEVRTPDGLENVRPHQQPESRAGRDQEHVGSVTPVRLSRIRLRETVVAYDRKSRDNLLESMEAKMSQTAVNSSQAVYSARQWADMPPFWFVSSRLLSGFIGLMILGLLVAVCWFLFDRWRLRRRARIGLERAACDGPTAVGAAARVLR